MSTTFKFGNKNWAWKEGSVLAYNDENNNFKPLPFDFTRSSSATRVNKEGLIEVVGSDEPRVDYLNNADGHLLLEPSRTNLVIRSDDASAGYWNISGTVTITADSEISPDGTQNADTLTISSPTGGLYSDDTSVSASTTYTFSFYAKRGTIASDETALAVRDQSNAAFISTDVTYSVTTDSWTRVEHTFTTPVGCTSVRLYPQRLSGLGQGTIHLWGFQLEQGSYATSYIPTSGSSVTRAADIAPEKAGNTSVFGDSEGILYVETAGLINGEETRVLSISDGSSANNVYINLDPTANKIQGAVRVGNVGQCALNANTTNQTEFNKIALKYKANDFALWINGTEVATDTVGSTFPNGTLDRFNFDFGQGSFDFYGKVKDIKVYNTALTDAQLIALTS